MPIVDGALLDTALFAVSFGLPAIAFALLLYLTDRDRDTAAEVGENRFAALATEYNALLTALDLHGISNEERLRRIAASKNEINDAHTWVDYARSLPTETAQRLARTQPQELARLMDLQKYWTTESMEAALSALGSRLADVAHMDVILHDDRARELEHITPAVQRGLWTFEPDFLVGADRLRMNVSVRTVAKELYDTEVADTIKERPDIVARSRSALSLQPNHQWQEGEEGTLLLELKNTRKNIGSDDQTQASGYIRQLVRAGVLSEREPVDCYVVGGGVHDPEGGPRIEGWYHNIRITSLSYDHLIERAKRLTLDVYDQIRDTTPFITAARADATAQLEQDQQVPLAAE